jgi:hypothetical protein
LITEITEKSKITDAELQSWKSIGCYVLSFFQNITLLAARWFLRQELVRVADLTSQNQSNQNGLGIEFTFAYTSNNDFAVFLLLRRSFSREEKK